MKNKNKGWLLKDIQEKRIQRMLRDDVDKAIEKIKNDPAFEEMFCKKPKQPLSLARPKRKFKFEEEE